MRMVTTRRLTAAVAMAAAASLAAATALAVPPPPSSSFAGSTNQKKAKHHDVALVTDANGHVSQMDIDWRARCKKKGIYWSSTTRLTGGTDGFAQTGDVFSQSGKYTGNASRKITGKITATLQGQFADADHASGTWNVSVVVRKKGKKIDKCKAKTIKWKVARPAP